MNNITTELHEIFVKAPPSDFEMMVFAKIFGRYAEKIEWSNRNKIEQINLRRLPFRNEGIKR